MNSNFESFLKYIKVEYPLLAKQEDINKIERERNDFIRKYPIETLDELKLSEYDQIKNKYSFCNMIENHTQLLGSGNLGNNSNKYFYQNIKGEYAIKKSNKINKYKGNNINEKFEKYIIDLAKFVREFDVKNYKPRYFLFNTSIIKSKLILIYKKNSILIITHAEQLKKMLREFGFAARSEDAVALNIRLMKAITELKPNFFELYDNKVIVGKCLYYYFNPKELTEDEQDDIYESKQVGNKKFTESSFPDKISKPKAKTANGRTVYPSNPKVRITALINSGFKCEVDHNHPTFISRTTNNQYLETHHLIPRNAQRLFKYSLDNPKNVVCLCSNCHNLLHYGQLDDVSKTLKNLYDKKQNELTQAGLTLSGSDITFNDLLRYYKV